MGRHNREGRGADQQGYEYQLNYQPDWLRLVKVTRELDLPLYVVGGGSNLVVADDGVDGVVMSLELLHQLVRDKNHVTASAGVTLPSLIRKTKDAGLKGLEVLIGIPAHVGGAIAMNAGTHDGTTFEHLVALTLVNTDGEIEAWDRDRMRPGYRDGGIGDRIVLNATWELEEDDPKAIHAKITRSKDALEYMSEGSKAMDKKRYMEAISLFDRAIEADPNYAFAYYLRAQGKKANRDFAGYKADLGTAEDKEPGAG